DMAPSTSGEAFQLDADSTFELSVQFTAEPDWHLDNMCVVAFVQNVSTHEVLQAAYCDVSIAYSMELTASSAHTRMVPPSSTALFIAMLTNLGTETDTYTATLGGDLPAGWTRTIQVQGGSPEPSSVTFSLDSYATATLIVTMNPQGNPGVADLSIHAASHAIPEITDDVDFVLLSGVDVLVVDDDEGASYENYYLAALEPFQQQFLYAAWDVSYNAPSASDLNQVSSIVWQTGNATTNTLSETERTNLANFLDNGGKLFLSGQGIGFDIGHPDPGTPFFTDYLHADFIGPYATGRTVYGVIGDPVSDGMSFNIYGGTGANNQTRQSDLDPLDAMATAFLTYTQGSFERNAGLRIETSSYRALYLGFGFEAIADEYNRNLLMANALDWLGVLAADKPDEAVQPFFFSLGAGYPNPFNPVVSISYALGERSQIRLSIYDILGREVAVLASGMQNPGTYIARWNGSALPSGIYFSRLTASSSGTSAFDATQKLILLK
ncbi:MAG: T9SS type A sorting domain-containing protein, partial [Calditrichaeota bacterium]|nr:T9SS type A sorting domain-containing protein [Calditrichota bacterium]